MHGRPPLISSVNKSWCSDIPYRGTFSTIPAVQGPSAAHNVSTSLHLQYSVLAQMRRASRRDMRLLRNRTPGLLLLSESLITGAINPAAPATPRPLRAAHRQKMCSMWTQRSRQRSKQHLLHFPPPHQRALVSRHHSNNSNSSSRNLHPTVSNKTSKRNRPQMPHKPVQALSVAKTFSSNASSMLKNRTRGSTPV